MTMLETSAGTVDVDIHGDGDPIVLLPSGAHERHDFDELRALLPDRFRTITLDWPGHGASPSCAGAASETRFAGIAEEVVAAVAADGVVILGNSVGGFAATRIAIRRPDLVKGLVIVDGGGFEGRTPVSRLFCALMGRPGFLRRIYPAFSARYMRARTDADRRARDAAIATTRRPDGARSVSELWRSFANDEHDLRTDATRIAAPTLVLWGRRDPVIPLKAGRRAARTIPGARLETLDTGHVPFTSDPAGVASVLVPFADSAFAAPAVAA